MAASFNEVKSAIIDPVGALEGLTPLGDVLGKLTELQNILSRPDMPPATRTRTSHGAYIYATVRGQTRVLGAVLGIAETQQIQQTDRWEINVLSEGTPNHIETGNVTGRTVTCRILELNNQLFERSLGQSPGTPSSDRMMLLSQLPSFNLVSLDYSPAGAIKYNQQFIDCKIENFGRTRNVDDDRLVQLSTVIRWSRLLNVR